MARLHVNPRYGPLLTRLGLVTAADFFDLDGVLIGGHADRSIARLTLGEGLTAYLKREYRVRWRDRLASAWAGFGLRSRSCREAETLRQLALGGVRCPEVIAAGEHGGRAFLLTHALSGMVDLRHLLREANPLGAERRVLASQLGQALAALHTAGFTHPDLYSKHILVGTETGSGSIRFALLDCQRSRRYRHLGWGRRARDLAALDATLADDLVTPRQRLACLYAYRRSLSGPGPRAPRIPRLAWLARAVRRLALRLLRRRRIRELRQPALERGTQQLCPLGGKGLRVTRQFRDELRGRVPEWLGLSGGLFGFGGSVQRRSVAVSPERRAMVVQRRTSQPVRWFWGRLWGKPVVSPEVERAGTLFRLERYGVRAPRLLAFGQHSTPPWRTESVLVTESPPTTVPLGCWLRTPTGQSAAALRQRRRLLREAGDVVRRLHEAACYLGSEADETAGALHVQTLAGAAPQLLVTGIETIRRRHRPSARLTHLDLMALRAALGPLCSRTDALRFLLAYLAVRRVSPDVRRLARHIASSRRQLADQRWPAVERGRL